MPTNMSTVADRMKRTGYIMGPRHRMFSSVGGEGGPGGAPAPVKPVAEGGQGERSEPPGLRDAEDGMECCGNCADCVADKDGAGMKCKGYGVPVTANMCCDDWHPEGEESVAENGSGEEEGAPPAGTVSVMRGMRVPRG